MAGRASIVGAAATHVGKVREHNEDAHFFDADAGLFVVCDGMGGHAAGEVASGIAIQTIRQRWSANEVQRAIDHWLDKGTPETKKEMLAAIRNGALAAHDAILAEAAEDEAKTGMGTTLVGAMVVGNELVFAHAGDSRAYIVRDNIAMQLTEDHTLLSRLLAAGIDVDLSGEGSRFRSMLTNALGIGQECKVATFVVPLADGDRFLLCSDGISEYVPEPEVGTVLTSSPSPARAAQRLIDLALDRGGGDNATAVVIRVLEAGETPQPVELRRKDDAAIQACPLWDSVSPQQRLRALRIAISRDVGANERLPAHTLGERVAWIIIDGEIEHGGKMRGPGALFYPESLVANSTPPERDSLAIARSDVRGLVLRADDFRELCEDDPELAELLHETLGKLVSKRGGITTQNEASDVGRMPTLDPDAPQPRRPRSETSEIAEPPPPIAPPLPITIPEDGALPSTPDDPPPVIRAKTPPRGSPANQRIERIEPRRSDERIITADLDPKDIISERPQTAPQKVVTLKPPPMPIPKVVPARPPISIPPKRENSGPLKIPTAPEAPVVVVTPKPVAPEPIKAADVVDLGSELRADLGGDHAIPKRRVSTPPPFREQTNPPVRVFDLEVEIEAVVEMEADEPDEQIVAAAAEDDNGEPEMTVLEMEADEPEEAVAASDDEPEMELVVEDPEPSESVVVSGTIKIEDSGPRKIPRGKRASEGWEDS